MHAIMIIDKMPVVLDRPVFKIISRLNIKWHIGNHANVIGIPQDKNIQISMHSMVMMIGHRLYPDKIKTQKCPILHINRINLDNRLDNLMYDHDNKNINKTCLKKKRNINLTRKGISSKNLPTYIWYMKPDDTHGERFIIQIKNIISWKSSSSRSLSLRFKLEESKKYLRDLLQSRPDLFNRSMNGDLTSRGYELYKQYEKIIMDAGYEMNAPVNNTFSFLQPDYRGLTQEEINLLG